ncbi:hypothetical protein HMN09_00507300 [Mycena chlorophos]|uniref:DUF6534 domain-containing protein n=1 Tax=Mycena chlorophos TaxID=658473 RepID=A0A8H6WCD2_MYCCL|nr:hypothetical protein HMN09_00507300 [Mycena chlorophos]
MASALDNTIGSSFVGVVVAATLYGVSCVQTWFYFSRYGASDVWYIKTLVCVCLAFDTIHQALISHTVYFYAITNYNNPEALERLVWSILLEVLFNVGPCSTAALPLLIISVAQGLIGLLVQGFLTMRVWRLSNRNICLTVVAGALVLAEFGCSVGEFPFTIQSMQLKTWQDLGQLKPLSMTVNVLGAASDFVIAMILVYYLRRSRTGFKKSDTMIRKLIVFSVTTGLLVGVCAIASLVSILLWGQTLIYVAFYFSLGRLEFNTLLATLNARKDILADDPEDISFSLQTMSKVVPRKLNSGVNPRFCFLGTMRLLNQVFCFQHRATLSIKIDTTHEVNSDRLSERSCNSPKSQETEEMMVAV